jgi:hypothetical protein
LLEAVVCTIPGMEAVTIESDTLYQTPGAGALTMDLYRTPNSKGGAPFGILDLLE